MNSESLHDFFIKEIYENIYENNKGVLKIKTCFVKKAAKKLGGNYDLLSDLQKFCFRNDIVTERVDLEKGFNIYLNRI